MSSHAERRIEIPAFVSIDDDSRKQTHGRFLKPIAVYAREKFHVIPADGVGVAENAPPPEIFRRQNVFQSSRGWFQSRARWFRGDDAPLEDIFAPAPSAASFTFRF